MHLQRSIADGHCHERYVTVRRCANRCLRQFPVGVIELRLKLRDRGVDAADLGIEREFGALLRRLGGVKLRRHGFVLNLLVLRLKLRVGIFRCKRLDVGETLLVVGDLRGAR